MHAHTHAATHARMHADTHHTHTDTCTHIENPGTMLSLTRQSWHTIHYRKIVARCIVAKYAWPSHNAMAVSWCRGMLLLLRLVSHGNCCLQGCEVRGFDRGPTDAREASGPCQASMSHPGEEATDLQSVAVG